MEEYKSGLFWAMNAHWVRAHLAPSALACSNTGASWRLGIASRVARTSVARTSACASTPVPAPNSAYAGAAHQCTCASAYAGACAALRRWQITYASATPARAKPVSPSEPPPANVCTPTTSRLAEGEHKQVNAVVEPLMSPAWEPDRKPTGSGADRVAIGPADGTKAMLTL